MFFTVAQNRGITVAISTFFVRDLQGESQLQSLEHLLTTINGVERALYDTKDNEIKIEYIEKEIELKDIVANIESHGFRLH